MFDKLQGMIDQIRQLPEPVQEELTLQIEVLLAQLKQRRIGQPEAPSTQRKHARKKAWENPVGAWADMPDSIDEMFESLDKIRHERKSPQPACGVLMRKYLLDTNVLGAYLRARPGAIALADTWIVSGQSATSIVIYGEIIEHLKSLADYVRYRDALKKLLIRVHPYPLNYAILERYADLRRLMRRTGLIGDIDTLIAATALEYGLTLVTTDSDFARVPGLLHQILLPNALK